MDEKLEQEYLEYDMQGRIWGNVPRERIRKIKFPRISKHIIEQYLLLNDLTSTISDVLDFLGLNGAVRDVNAICRLDYPVWRRGQTPISGKHRMGAIEINGPVMLHSVVVNPGDLIVADDSGVCCCSRQGRERAR
jgi:hypothetical protein